MSKNKIIKIWIIRKNDSDAFVIGFIRKYGERAIRFFSGISLVRAERINKIAICSNHYTQDAGFGNAHWRGKAFNLDIPKPQTLKVYFVQVGMDGYLPDSVSAYPTLAQAIKAAQAEKRFDLDNIDGKIRVLGDIRKHGEYEVLQDESYYHSIRIVPEAISGDSFIQTHAYDEPITNRRQLESFCDWYNDQGF